MKVHSLLFLPPFSKHTLNLFIGKPAWVASQIKPGNVEEYREKKLLRTHYRGKTYRPASINRELEVMRRLFNLAMPFSSLRAAKSRGPPLALRQPS
jgi:hypothetical protein